MILLAVAVAFSVLKWVLFAVLIGAIVHRVVERRREIARLEEERRAERAIDVALEEQSREIANLAGGGETYCAECRRMVEFPTDHRRECTRFLHPATFDLGSPAWENAMLRIRERDRMYAKIENRS